MKRVHSFLLLLLILCTVCYPSASAAQTSIDKAVVMETAKDYLSKQMSAVYLRTSIQEKNSSPRTLLDIVGEQTAIAEEESLGSDIALLNDTLNLMVTFIEKNSPNLMSEMNRFVSIDTMLGDLQCMEDMVEYKSYIFEDQNIMFSDFNAEYHFGDITIDGNHAVIELFEELNYQYSDCNEPSYELGEFNVALVKLNDEWIVADVISDDIAFLAYCDSGYDVKAEISAYDSARKNANIARAESTIIQEDTTTAGGETDITYIKENAVNYALTYTTQGDDGQKTPSFKNDRFKWFGADCMNFCSQCVWAGFGGSNSSDDIADHQGMDTDNPLWWCDKSDQSSNGSWASCSAFRSYVSSSKNASTKGLVCDSESIEGSNNVLPYSKSDLVGAVLHVEGYANNVPTAKAHAVFVNAATGNTRDEVMVCSYNKCRKNTKLSLICPVGGKSKAIETIVPQSFRDGGSDIHIYGDLHNVIVSNTANKTLNGYSNVTLSNFEMALFKPNGEQADKWATTNSEEISATYNDWDTAGEWIMKLTGTTSSGETMTWYGTIRVV